MQPTTQDQASITETQLCGRINKCPRTLLNWRKAGKTPPHFIIQKQVRYLLSDVLTFEEKLRA